jgi:hypothetical protein
MVVVLSLEGSAWSQVLTSKAKENWASRLGECEMERNGPPTANFSLGVSLLDIFFKVRVPSFLFVQAISVTALNSHALAGWTETQNLRHRHRSCFVLASASYPYPCRLRWFTNLKRNHWHFVARHWKYDPSASTIRKASLASIEQCCSDFFVFRIIESRLSGAQQNNRRSSFVTSCSAEHLASENDNVPFQFAFLFVGNSQT